MTTDSRKLSMQTRAVHAGEPAPRVEGALVLPVFQSSTYETTGDSGYHDLPYLRLNNSPNHLALHRKLADLEGAEEALVTSSGMAAIFTALLSVLDSGDHLLAQRGLYGGTHTLLSRDLPALGISCDFVDLHDSDEWHAGLRPNTRAIYVETITNPLLTVADLHGVVSFAREQGLVSLIDNTLASPVNCNPLALGFDVVLHSATKYLNGHSDIVAGVIAGSGDLLSRCKHKLDHLGGTLDPHACFLLQRGMKTLPLRVERQNANALAIARYLESHDAVTGVHYPGLESHRNHDRARALLKGFGGVLSFDHCGGGQGAGDMLRRLELVTPAVSLGGVETLVTMPAASSHSGLSPEERQKIGIGDGLVRLAVGIEGVEDLVSDLEQALSTESSA